MVTFRIENVRERGKRGREREKRETIEARVGWEEEERNEVVTAKKHGVSRRILLFIHTLLIV